MTEFELVLLGCALFIAFFIVGCLIDKYREVANLQKAYDAKTEQCVVTYEAMLTLIREFNKEELELYLKDYSERLCDLYPEHNGNKTLIKIYELLVEEIELRLSSLDEDERSSGGITVDA